MQAATSTRIAAAARVKVVDAAKRVVQLKRPIDGDPAEMQRRFYRGGKGDRENDEGQQNGNG